MRRPDFGGDEHLVALDAGGAQPLAHLAFVVVQLGGVDVAVAEPQRLLDDPRAGTPAQLPGAETDQRDAGAVRFDDGAATDITTHLRSASLVATGSIVPLRRVRRIDHARRRPA